MNKYEYIGIVMGTVWGKLRQVGASNGFKGTVLSSLVGTARFIVTTSAVFLGAMVFYQVGEATLAQINTWAVQSNLITLSPELYAAVQNFTSSSLQVVIGTAGDTLSSTEQFRSALSNAGVQESCHLFMWYIELVDGTIVNMHTGWTSNPLSLLSHTEGGTQIKLLVKLIQDFSAGLLVADSVLKVAFIPMAAYAVKSVVNRDLLVTARTLATVLHHPALTVKALIDLTTDPTLKAISRSKDPTVLANRARLAAKRASKLSDQLASTKNNDVK